MRLQEGANVWPKGEGPDAHVVCSDAQLVQLVDGLEHGGMATAQRYNADARAGLLSDLRSWNLLRRGLELPLETIHHLLVLGRILGVCGVLGVARPTRDIRSLGS